MKIRHATCCCGAVRVRSEGEPLRVSVCHCFACQRRTGSAFGAQARFADHQVELEADSARMFARTTETGNIVRFWFCGDCGTTMWWRIGGLDGFVMVAIGGFADSTFPEPTVSVYEDRQHPWCQVQGAAPMTRIP